MRSVAHPTQPSEPDLVAHRRADRPRWLVAAVALVGLYVAGFYLGAFGRNATAGAVGSGMRSTTGRSRLRLPLRLLTAVGGLRLLLSYQSGSTSSKTDVVRRRMPLVEADMIQSDAPRFGLPPRLLMKTSTCRRSTTTVGG